MPIGDLLAQINGGQPSPATTPVLQRSNTVPKRKAEDELRGHALKTPRPSTPKVNQPSQPDPRPLPSQRPTNGHVSRPSVPPVKRPGDMNKVVKPAGPARPAPAFTNGGPAKAAPKKGSFAEILARGQRAQTVMGQVGKIQHKKVEKGAGLKKKEDLRAAPKGRDVRPTGHSGGVKPARPANGSGAPNGTRNGAAVSARPDTARAGAGRKATEQEQEKKVKKAVQATTGYTGTARPKPGAASKKAKGPTGGALLNRLPSRPSSSKQSRYEDDYDEELEDFIDYDDEEDEGPRYDYASDASSDMEAGLDDIDVEERRAEQIARREDVEEERLEKTLKVAKEERKRKALEALRAGRRH